MYQSYGKLSTKYYQNSKPIGHEIMGDITFYKNKLMSITGPILEAGVGTGRMMIPLLEAELDVEGIDASRAMLEICEQECQARSLAPKLEQKDLSQLKVETYYSAIIMPTGSFMLLDQAMQVLRKFYDALQDDGILIFDLEPFKAFEEGKQSTSVLPINEDEGIVLNMSNMQHDPIFQFTKTLLKYEHYKNGSLVESEIQDFVLYYYGLREIEYMLKEVGFASIEFIANYKEGKMISSDAEIITVIAKKDAHK